ncbi:MAG: carboxypeptidase regulatory-like domain-containing protein [Bryobacteraceae bacterium]|jgi:protocatechuate 3,4-dioxygenase beta subunit
MCRYVGTPTLTEDFVHKRYLSLLFFPAVLCAQVVTPLPAGTQPAPDPTLACTIEGAAVDASTGQPVRNASIVLRPGPGSSSSATASAASTDNEGKFAIKGIVAGTYRLTAAHSGYLQTEYGARRPGGSGSTISLSPEQTLRALVLRMYRQGVIAGRVVDDAGDSVERAQVSALQYQYVGRDRQLLQTDSTNTDDQGNYRIFGLAPGRYILRAQTQSLIMGQTSDVQSEYAYLPAYYPGTSDESLATPLDLGAGAQLPGIDFTLAKSRVYRVQLQVQNQTGAAGRIMVMLQARQAVFTPGSSRINPVDAKNKLDLRNISPGSYILMASMSDQNQIYSGRVDIEVVDRDLENIVIPLRPCPELAGEVKTEDDAPINFASLRVTLASPTSVRVSTGGLVTSAIGFGTSVAEKVGDDGKFVLHDIFPDSPRPTVSPLPDGFYVKSIQLNDQEVLESGLDFSHGAGGPLRFVLSGKAGTVQGVVGDDDDNPAASATVVLVPKSDTRRALPQFYKIATTNQQGQFTIRNVDPGDYRVFAWEDVETGAWLDPDFVKPFDSKATGLTVDPSGHPQFRLKSIPAGK